MHHGLAVLVLIVIMFVIEMGYCAWVDWRDLLDRSEDHVVDGLDFNERA
jgi:hypothetical protein